MQKKKFTKNCKRPKLDNILNYKFYKWIKGKTACFFTTVLGEIYFKGESVWFSFILVRLVFKTIKNK